MVVVNLSLQTISTPNFVSPTKDTNNVFLTLSCFCFFYKKITQKNDVRIILLEINVALNF